MTGTRTGRLVLAAAGAAIVLLAWWLRNPLIPYGADTPRASGISADSARADDAALARLNAIRGISGAIVSTEALLGRIASEALSAPPDPETAFEYLKNLTATPESGVLLEENSVALAWAGQIRATPVDGQPGTVVSFTPFYATLQVMAQRGNRKAVATALIHADPPANRVASALDARPEIRSKVESFRFAPLSDSTAGEIIKGSNGNALLRVDATPLSTEATLFTKAAAARARGIVVVCVALLLLIGAGWSDRRSLGTKYLTIAAALGAIALIPWNNFSNFSRLFDPAYFYTSAGGPFTANTGVLLMLAALFVIAIIAAIRSRRVSVHRSLAVVLSVGLLIVGVVAVEALANGIVLPPWGATISLWLSWQVPLFLILFACWLAAVWMGRIAGGLRPMVTLRIAALIALSAGGVATFIVWTKTTEQRLQLAMRDVAGLQRVDSDAALLLARFGTQLAGYDSAGSRADILKRYAISDLAPGEIQVSLATWRRDGSQSSRLDLARLPFDTAALRLLVSEARHAGRPLIRRTLGPIGRQALMAVPHRDGQVTSAVTSARTRLVVQNSYAPLLGFEQPEKSEPPYVLTLADPTPGTGATAGVMTWRRIGDEWHGDEIIATSVGYARAHVEVDIRSWPTRLVRAALIIVLDIAIVALLWALSAMAEGGFFRWLRRRSTAWMRSYRGRLTLALFMFFVIPAVAFAAWSYQRLRGDGKEVRELLVGETLHAATNEDSVAPGVREGDTPLFLYSNSFLVSTSDPLYELIAPSGRMLPRPVQLSISDGGELTETWQQRVANTRILWGFRAAASPAHTTYILAAPARSDEIVLDRRRRDLTLLVLFATAIGAIAAFWLSGIAAKILARDLELSRIEVARAERVLAWGEMARQVAHEIKNPLTPIRLGVQHLRRARVDPRIDFDRVLDENVTRILSEIDRLDEIARSFSRYGSAPQDLPSAEQVDVAAAVRDVVGLERIGIGGVQWNFVGGNEPALALARADELRDVLLNLFENARLARAKSVDVKVFRGAKSVTIEIVDNGAGIPSATMPRVFEPHFSTRTTGSGLGLAISRRLLESWGGTIDIDSEEGNGARVTIVLQTLPG